MKFEDIRSDIAAKLAEVSTGTSVLTVLSDIATIISTAKGTTIVS